MSYWVGGDPPCWVTNDHYWRGGSCSQCGERLRCGCGRFVTIDNLETHIVSGECPFIQKMEREEQRAAK